MRSMWLCALYLHDPPGPPGHGTSIAEETTTDHSPEGELMEVASKKKKKTDRKSTPRASRDKPVVQQRTPSSPKKTQRTQSPLQDISREGRTHVGADKEYPLHKKYDLDEVVTDKLENRDCRYVIIRAYR